MVSTLYYVIFMIFMIFMVVFVALTNGLQAAILVSAGQECLLYSLNANVGERGGFTPVGADSGSGVVAGVVAGACRSWCSCGFVAVSAGAGF